MNGLEAVWVETKIDQESLLVGSFYRPPNSSVNYWELISDSIRKANNCVVKFIILGDFNTDFFSNPSQHLMNILNVYQPLQLTNSATRITESTSSCLDLIMTQSPHIMSRTEVLPARQNTRHTRGHARYATDKCTSTHTHTHTRARTHARARAGTHNE